MIKGLIEIYKDDGNSIEKIYSDNNLITVGLGYSLASFFETQEVNRTIDDYQIGFFQIGSGTVDYRDQQTSNVPCFYQIQTPVAESLLGTDLDINIYNLKFLLKSTSFSRAAYSSSLDMDLSTAKRDFLEILPSQKINNLDGSITHKLILEKNLAPNVSIKELGIFIKNPDSGYKIDRPMLAAYKALSTPIVKNTNFKLIVDWTIYFKD
jgi:hypothetical protein